MVKVEDAVIARLKTHGQNFEVLVDCDNAIKVKEGEDIDSKDVLATEQIFSDSKKGEVAPETALKQIFSTDSSIEIAWEIIKKGEIQLTSEHRKKLLDEKRKQIINTIHRNGVDPKTNLPHPMTRLENAFEHARIRIDEYKGVKIQIQEIVKKLMPILPIKFAKKKIQLTIPPEYASKSQYILRSFGRIISEDWQNDGSFTIVIEIPGGMEQELYEKVNSVCHGNLDSKVIETS